MIKRTLSMLMIISMVLQTIPFTPSFAEDIPLPPPEIQFFGDSYWRGYGSEVGDNILYIELRGKLINTSAGNIKAYLYENLAGDTETPNYIEIGETTESVYLGKNSLLQDVVIQKITLDSGRVLQSKYYSVEFTDELGNTIIPGGSTKPINGLVIPNPMDYGYVSQPWNTYVNADLSVMNFNIILEKYKQGLSKYDLTLSLIQSEDIYDLDIPAITVGVVDPESILVNYIEGGTYSIDASFMIGSNLDKSKPIYISITAPDKLNQPNQKYSGQIILLDSSIPAVKRFELLQAIPGMGPGHDGMSGSIIAKQYVSAASDSLDISFESLGMDDISKLSFVLKNVQGTEISTNLSTPIVTPLSNGLDFIDATLNIEEALDTINTLEILYNGSLITSATIESTSVEGTGYFLIDGEYISAYVYNYKVSPSSYFNITLLEALNMDPTKFTINFYESGTVNPYIPLSGTLVSSLPLSGSVNGTTIDLTSPSFNLLEGSYDFKILYDGGEIKQAYESGGTYKATGDFFMSKDMNIEISSIIEAGLKNVLNINNSIIFDGFEFSPDRTYTAYFIVHGTTPLTATPFEIPATFVTNNKLLIPESQQSNLPRGWYNIYLKDDLGVFVNGIEQVSLLATSSSSQIILPTAAINSGDEYTMDRNVTININKGSFTHIKVANSTDELLSAPWTTIATTMAHILSDGFGNKTVYMQFKDSGGFEYSLNDSILYRGDILEDMTSFGVINVQPTDDLYNFFVGGSYRFYINSSSRDLRGYIEFYNSDTLMGEPIVMNRTLSQNNIHTYSKEIIITDQMLGANKIAFYLMDNLDFTSKKEIISSSINDQAWIKSTDALFKKVYYDKEYIMDNSEFELRIVGIEGFRGSAVLNYLDNSTVPITKSVNIQIPETSIPGAYQVLYTLPADVGMVQSIVYSLEDQSSSTNIAYETKQLDKEVTATIKFVGLPNGSGAYNDKIVAIDNIYGTALSEYLIKENETEIFFKGLSPKDLYNYNYRIFDNFKVYNFGTVSNLRQGINQVSLAGLSVPAKVTPNITGLDSNEQGRIRLMYNLPNGIDSKPLDPDGVIREFSVGDEITYWLEFDPITNKKYKDKGILKYTVALQSDNLIISLEKLPMIKVSGKITDARKLDLAIGNVSISIQQQVNNHLDFTHITNVNTDEYGNYEAYIYPASEAQFTFTKLNYSQLQLKLTESENFELNKSLEYSISKILTLKPLTRELIRSDESITDFKYVSYDPINIKTIRLFDENDTVVYSIFYRQNGYVDLKYINDLENKNLKAKVEFYDKETEQAEYLVQLDQYFNGILEPVAVPNGEFLIDVANTNDGNTSTYYALIFNDDNKMVGVLEGLTRISTSSLKLQEGYYKLVFIKGFELGNLLMNYSTLDSFQLLDLENDIDYVATSGEIINGQIKVLEDVNVPNITNKEVFGSSSNTISSRFFPNSSGGQLKILAQLNHLNEDPSRSFSYAYITTNGRIIDNKAYIDGKLSNTTSYISPEIKGNPNSTIYFYMIPNFTEKTYVNLHLVYNFFDEVSQTPRTTRETLSLDNLDLPPVTLLVPDQTIMGEKSKEVYIRGVGEPNSTIEILEGDLVLGEVAILSTRTSYALNVSLPNPDQPGAHVLTARMTISDSEVYESHPSIIEIIDPSVMAYTKDFSFINGFGKPITYDGPGDSNESLVFSYNPYYTNTITFKIANLINEDLEYVAFVNTYNGIEEHFEAEHVSDFNDGIQKYSEWRAVAKIANPGDLSVYYAPKKTTHLGYISGSRQIDFEEATRPVQPDPSLVPTSVLNSSNRTVNSTYNNLEINIPVGTDGYLKLIGTFEEDVPETPETLVLQGYQRIDTLQGPYWYKESLDNDNGVWKYNRKVYYSPQLTAILKEGSIPIGIRGLSGPMFVSAGDFMPLGFFDSALSFSDYTGYLYNLGDFVAETGGNSSGFGIGGKMQVLGGVTFAAQALSGPTSKDPAYLSQLVMQVNDPEAYRRIQADIRQYERQRRSTHTVSTILGGASYGAGFGGPIGKGLSYLISSGGMIFGSKSGKELDIWYDAILRDIQNELDLQEYRKKKKPGKGDDIKKPKWKMDPSGYLFEAVDSQRIPNITSYALTGVVEPYSIWEDAEEWDEINPDISDIDGKYGWDVPEGNWQVLFMGNDEYQTAYTKTMVVPPVHDEVNIGLISKIPPQVKDVVLIKSVTENDETTTVSEEIGFEIEFDSFITLETLFDSDSSVNNIRIQDSNGNNIGIESVEYITGQVDEVYKDTNNIYQSDYVSGKTFAKRVLIKPIEGEIRELKDDGITPEEYSLTILNNVQSYSGVGMSISFTKSSLTLEEKGILAIPVASLPSGTYTEIEGLDFTSNDVDAAIYYTTDGSTPTTLSRNWTAETKVSDVMKNISKSTLFKVIAAKNGCSDSPMVEFRYIIADESTPVAEAPTSSLESGTYTGTISITLSTATQNGVIIYTIDGKTPQSNSTIYSGPIAISEDTEIRAVTVKDGHINSSISIYKYIIAEGSSQPIIAVPPIGNDLAQRITTITIKGYMFNGVRSYNLGIESIMSVIDKIKENNSNKTVIHLENMSSNNITRLSIPMKFLEEIYNKETSELFIKSENIILNFSRSQLGQFIANGSDLLFEIDLVINDLVNIRILNPKREPIILDSKIIFGIKTPSSSASLVFINENTLISFSNNKDGFLFGYDNNPIILKISENKMLFNDVSNQWFEKYIDFVSSRELFNGTGDGKFSPNAPMTRGMLATVLYRLSLSDNPIFVSRERKQFSDVNESMYYAHPINWAYERKIISGYGDNIFGPDSFVTREQIALMMYNYFKANSLYSDKTDYLANYVDKDELSSWALEAMNFALGSGLLQGKGNGILDPSGNATRAEVAAILTRYIQNVLK